MSSGSYGHTDHGLPVESMPQSGGESGQSETDADTIATETINDYRMNHGPPAIRPVVSNPHFNGDPYANYTSTQPTSFHGSGAPSSFTGIGTQDAGFPGPPVMGSLGQTPCPGPSITQGQGRSERAEFSVGAVRAFIIYGNSLSHSEWTATSLAGSATDIQYTHADDTPHDSVSSAVPPDPWTPITAQYQHRAQHDQPRKVQKKRKRIPPTPSQSSQRPAGIRGTRSKRKYLCDVPGCGKPFNQSQGRDRHKREVHHVGVEAYHDWHCVRCHKSWPSGRGHEWKGHLVKEHPDIDADEEYKKAKKNRRGFDPQERISSPILEDNRQVRAESQVYPPTPPLPATAMTKLSLVSPPATGSAFPQVDSNLQSEFAEPTVMRSEREDICHSEALNSTRAGLFSLTEERSQIAKDPDAYNHRQIWHTSQDGRPAIGFSSDLVPVPAFIAAPPVSEYHGNLVPVTHAVDPPISTSSSLAHALDDGIWTHGLAEYSPSGEPYATWPSPDIDAGSVLDISVISEDSAN